MKNVAYGLVLSAALLTVSGCCNWFSGSCGKNEQQTAETKEIAENDVQVAAEAATAVAEASVTAAENVEQKIEAEKVASADAMPMNEVAPATEEKVA